MKNHNPSGGSLRFASTGQRFVALLVLAVFAGMVWAASTGRFDREINQISTWMRGHYETLTR